MLRSAGRHSRVSLLVVGLVLSGPPSPAAAVQQESLDSAGLDSLIAERMEERHIPGLAVAAVDSGRVVWIGTYGWADVENRQAVTDSTPFMIASVSKTLTATILMSLHADGLFELDDDINEVLPFPVRNPNHPAAPITYRHLLRHRSSLADSREFYEPHWGEANGDPTTTLAGYLADYLSPIGADYDASENFLDDPPDFRFRYCNTCYALLGYLAEVISGKPFEQLSAEVLFTPLELSETAWFLRDLEGPEPSMPYRFAADSGFVAYGQNGYPDWPAGQLRTSIRDIARFLAVYSNGGTFNGEEVIDLSTIQTLSPRSANIGFHTWFQRGLSNGQIVWDHGGGDLGVVTEMAFHRGSRRGVVVLTNGEAAIGDILEAVFLAIDNLKESDASNE